MNITKSTKTYTSKAVARRLTRRLRDHGLLSTVDYGRGHNAVTILIPDHFDPIKIDALCERIVNEGRA